LARYFFCLITYKSINKYFVQSALKGEYLFFNYFLHIRDVFRNDTPHIIFITEFEKKCVNYMNKCGIFPAYVSRKFRDNTSNKPCKLVEI